MPPERTPLQDGNPASWQRPFTAGPHHNRRVLWAASQPKGLVGRITTQGSCVPHHNRRVLWAASQPKGLVCRTTTEGSCVPHHNRRVLCAASQPKGLGSQRPTPAPGVRSSALPGARRGPTAYRGACGLRRRRNRAVSAARSPGQGVMRIRSVRLPRRPSSLCKSPACVIQQAGAVGWTTVRVGAHWRV